MAACVVYDTYLPVPGFGNSFNVRGEYLCIVRSCGLRMFRVWMDEVGEGGVIRICQSSIVVDRHDLRCAASNVWLWPRCRRPLHVLSSSAHTMVLIEAFFGWFSRRKPRCWVVRM